MVNKIKVEIMCGSIDDVITATKANVDQIELNQAIELLGLTPTISTLKCAKRICSLPIICMVRTRGAGFSYSKNDFDIMLEDAKLLIENGADGIVFGFLNDNGSLNVEYTKRMVDIIGAKDSVFHKAFDHSRDLEETIQQLIKIGVKRVLTEGGNHNGDILKGLHMITYLQEKYSDQIEIMPAGGIRPNNILKIIHQSNCNIIHFSAKEWATDPSTNEMYLRVSKNILNNMLEIIRTDSN